MDSFFSMIGVKLHWLLEDVTEPTLACPSRKKSDATSGSTPSNQEGICWEIKLVRQGSRVISPEKTSPSGTLIFHMPKG